MEALHLTRRPFSGFLQCDVAKLHEVRCLQIGEEAVRGALSLPDPADSISATGGNIPQDRPPVPPEYMNALVSFRVVYAEGKCAACGRNIGDTIPRASNDPERLHLA